MAFLGSTLLFSMEPLVGRYLTLYFGSAAHVWLTTLMFFQAVLFLGYLYAHLVAPRIGRWHLAVLLLPLLALPLKVSAEPNANMPVALILYTLLVNVALPFAAVSTTPSWHNSGIATVGKRRNRIFSMERRMPARSWDWWPTRFSSNRHRTETSEYALVGGIRSLLRRGGGQLAVSPVGPNTGGARGGLDGRRREGAPAEKISAGRSFNWLAISATTSALLLAVTNFIAMEVGSFPFVWILPLGLYLCSFILTFRSADGAMRFIKWFWVELLLIGFAMSFAGNTWLWMFALATVFFLICLVAHRLLYFLRPTPTHLTSYYLMISFGCWVGGAFVSLLAPRIFNGLFEYSLILGVLCVLFWCNRRDFFWGGAFRYRRAPFLAHTLLIVAILVPLVKGIYDRWGDRDLARHRNFYGGYRVFDRSLLEGKRRNRIMHNGATMHGAQMVDEALCTLPITYYYAGGQITDCLERVPDRRRVAVVGLGAGTIASYARPGDQYTYYEIDPDLEALCREHFTYLQNCEGDLRVIPGDGRLSLETSREQTDYDLIVVDAFTGDGIPIHLLTTDAIKAYRKCVKPDGVICSTSATVFTTSNRCSRPMPTPWACYAQARRWSLPKRRRTNTTICPRPTWP
jgi:hypothetical protein